MESVGGNLVRGIAYLGLFLGMLTTLPTEAAEEGAQQNRLSLSFDIGTRWEDNINFGSDEVEPENPATGRGGYFGDKQLEDWTLNFAGAINYNVIQRQGQELSVSAGGFYNNVDEYNNLSNWGAEFGIAYRGEFGPGFTDPWYSASVNYTMADFKESRVREGDWIEAEIAIGKRFNPKWGLSGGVRYFERDQENGRRLCPSRTFNSAPDCPLANPNRPEQRGWRADEVFDQERWGLFVHADWFFANKTSAFFEYSFWDGDEDATLPITSAVQMGNLNPDLLPGWINNQDIFADDDEAFGRYTRRGIPSANPNSTLPYIVWKVETKQHVLEAGVNHAFTDNVSVEFVVAHLFSDDAESTDRTFTSTSVDDYENTAVMLTAHFTVN